MRSIHRGALLESHVDVTAAAGWRLWAPRLMTMDGSATDRILDVIWLFGLLLPAGYWGCSPANRRHESRAAIRPLLLTMVAVVPVLLVGPWMGLMAATAAQWFAAWAGIVAGAVLAGYTGRSSTRAPSPRNMSVRLAPARPIPSSWRQ